MSRMAKELKPQDFFKILKDKPQDVEITQVKLEEPKFYDDDDFEWTLEEMGEKPLDYEYIILKLVLVDTNQYCNQKWEISYGDTTAEHYISIEDEIHPILAYESGLEGTALIYWDEELIEALTGLRFKAKGIIKKTRNETKYILSPISERRPL